MEPTKRKIFITFSILCTAVSVLMGFQYFGSMVYTLTDEWLMNQEAGVLRRLSWLFHSPWTDTLVQYVFLIGAAYVPVYLMVCRLPKDTGRRESLGGRDFLLCLTAAMGMGYAMNLIGNMLNLLISFITGKSFLDMNPVMDMMMQMSPSMIVYSCLLGPFMEELLFRGILLKRARIFGDRTAVVFTAILFGMMHGNLAQFLYATVIGLIFGYVAVRTNSIWYTVWMHIIVNTYNNIVAWGEVLILGIDQTFLPLLYSMAFFASIVLMIIGGIVVLVKYGKHWYDQLTWHNGPWCPWKYYVYLNPGFFLYVVLCGVEFLMYMI